MQGRVGHFCLPLQFHLRLYLQSRPYHPVLFIQASVCLIVTF
nr:MAG TPA: hypothetical protein [Caudoviricetes sp.]